jgi:hypothetical protein
LSFDDIFKLLPQLSEKEMKKNQKKIKNKKRLKSGQKSTHFLENEVTLKRATICREPAESQTTLCTTAPTERRAEKSLQILLFHQDTPTF